MQATVSKRQMHAERTGLSLNSFENCAQSNASDWKYGS
eukprot:SAG31_NODE_2899_length_4933_cov_2.793795_2_plen_38_part_00